eukprot:646225-Alexandrium_andersonii.AAC.1
MRTCVPACVRSCVRACVRACLSTRACVRGCRRAGNNRTDGHACVARMLSLIHISEPTRLALI